MTGGQKALTAIVVGGILYLVLAKKGSGGLPPIDPRDIAVADAERVMGHMNNMLASGMEHGIDPALIASMVTVESGGRPDVLGRSGEIGLMQILPATGTWISRVPAEQLWNPQTNIHVGTMYLRYCIDRWNGNVAAGVAGYNYGPDRVVLQDNKLVLPDVVAQYTQKVLSLVGSYKAIFRRMAGHFYSNFFNSDRLILDGLNCRLCRS